MCSNIDNQNIPPEKYSTELCDNVKCVKCEEDAIIIIRKDHSFCSACFLSFANHKFRSSFGKSKVIRDGENVLVAYSGGHCSTTLLHMILQGKSPRTPKKLRFNSTLIYIDESALLDSDDSHKRTKIFESMTNTGLPCITCRIEQVMDENFLSDNAFHNNTATNELEQLNDMLKQVSISENTSKLIKLLKSAKTTTCKDYLLRRLRQKLLISYAKRTGHSHVILGNTASNLSIQLISNVVQGRGAHVANEMAFCHPKDDGVTIVQPLRDFLTKEISMYLELNGLNPIYDDLSNSKNDCKISIDQLAESFISGLQSEYPSTVSTIFRTGEKLVTVNESDTNSDGKCSICMLPLDTNVSSSSALSATLFSQKLCRKEIIRNCNEDESIGDTINDGNCCNTNDDCCNNSKPIIIRDMLRNSLCYGCQLIVKDMSDIKNLPESVLDHSMQVNRRKLMKAQIQDFILENEYEEHG